MTTDSANHCPNCQYEYPYPDGRLWVCPDCQHEWDPSAAVAPLEVEILDANGKVLSNGDAVTVAKDLKIKGSSQTLKVGTKVKNIRLLTEAQDGHNLACKIEGFGSLNLKSEFVKKS